MVTLQSTAFENNAPIPRKFSREGEDISPPLQWGGVPEGAKSFALVCEDPDAPTPKPFVHWVLANIPGDRDALGEGDTAGAVEGSNDFSEQGYGGPMPPEGHGTHHYHFKLFALDSPVEVEPGASKEELVQKIEPHVLDSAELVGTYER